MDPLESPGYVLWQLTHAMQQRMTAALAAMNLNLPQLGTLVHLARGTAVSTADLARLVLMTPQNMSLTVAKLEAQRYIARRPHETHRRINRLELTKTGHAALRRAIVRVSKVENQMLRDLTPSDRQQLVRILRGGLDNLNAPDKPRRKTPTPRERGAVS